MKCDDFRTQLFQFVDGELAGATARAAAAHTEACSDCAERAQFERSVEIRLRAALLSDASEVDASALVSRSRASRSRASGSRASGSRASGLGASGSGTVATAAPRARSGPVRSLLAAAAVLVLAVQVAWFFCIPPFECSLLQAVERTTAQSGVALRPGMPGPQFVARIDAGPSLAGFELEGDPILLTSTPPRVRAHYVLSSPLAGAASTETFDVVWSDAFGMEPSFRRKRVVDRQTWWVAEENGRQLVAWMCPATRTLCTLVSELPEERLLEIAGEIRLDEPHRVPR